MSVRDEWGERRYRAWLADKLDAYDAAFPEPFAGDEPAGGAGGGSARDRQAWSRTKRLRAKLRAQGR